MHACRGSFQPSLAGKMAETAGVGEHDEGDVDIAEDGELVSLLNKPISAFREGDLSIGVIFYFLNLQFNTTHSFSLFSFFNEEEKKNWGQKRKACEPENLPI